MGDQPTKPRLMVVFGSLIAAALLSFFIYFFSIQTPILSRREPFIAFLLFICFTPLIYLLLTRFIVINLAKYNRSGRFSWLLLSGLIGFLAVFTTIKTPFYIQLLPAHHIKVQIPGSISERSITLQWFTSGLGDIGFGQLAKEGSWEQTPLGLTYTGSQPAALEWTGRAGDFSRMVFLASLEPTDVSITVDGNPNPATLSVSTDSATTFEADFQVSIFHQLPVWLSYWFSTSFLFLTITLFLVHVSIKLGGRSLSG